MTEVDLLTIVQECEKLVQIVGMLPYEISMYCTSAYETLKEIVADGDYTKYRQWYDENAEKLFQEDIVK